MSGAKDKGLPYGLIAIGVVAVVALAVAGFFVFSNDDGDASPDKVTLAELPAEPGVLALQLQGVWQRQFRAEDRKYEDVGIEALEDAADAPTVCKQDAGNEVSFYCVENRTLYLDGAFLDEVEADGGALARVYVVAHLMGHHVQEVLGIYDKAVGLQSNPDDVPLVRRQLELEADCLAGFGISGLVSDTLSGEELADAIETASAAAESRVKESQSNTNAETWDNAPVDDQVQWVETGLGLTDVGACDTFGGQVTEVPPR
jgi:uncharacterized protein